MELKEIKDDGLLDGVAVNHVGQNMQIPIYMVEPAEVFSQDTCIESRIGEMHNLVTVTHDYFVVALSIVWFLVISFEHCQPIIGEDHLLMLSDCEVHVEGEVSVKIVTGHNVVLVVVVITEVKDFIVRAQAEHHLVKTIHDRFVYY
ncbi:hypothetical protein [Legionella qingyii]|uniref:hypothetical protein n=1 Tax=Legionella qingyii TaxID=2184757 RepID=UPI001057D9E0|nr:hypothetical protein [Legionella qingyii]